MEKRLLRITWNENRWEMPSGHRWSIKKQGDGNVAFENQYGFGGEEWLFNSRYNVDGFQYGYIRGLWEVTSTDNIDEAVLFSIEPETKDRYLIAKLKNIELLDYDTLPIKVGKHFRNGKSEMLEELKNVNADYLNFKIDDFLPFVKFKMSDTIIYDVPILANELKTDSKYNRFKPYIINDELKELLNNKTKFKLFQFNPGKRKGDKVNHIKNTVNKSITVKGTHIEIIKQLEFYLKPDYSILKNNISIEKTLFGENIADIVIKNEDNTFTIFEVKTSNNTRYNVREAIGQLLDYSLWHDHIKIKELVIVAPSVVSDLHKKYLGRLSKAITIPIKYLNYNNTSKNKFEEVSL